MRKLAVVDLWCFMSEKEKRKKWWWLGGVNRRMSIVRVRHCLMSGWQIDIERFEKGVRR